MTCCLHCFGHQVGKTEDGYPVYLCNACNHMYLGSKIFTEADRHKNMKDVASDIIGLMFRPDGYKEIYDYAPAQRENTERIMVEEGKGWRYKEEKS